MVAQVAREFEDRVPVVGVASRDQVEAMQAFVERHDLSHVPHAADVDGEVWERFGITGQPAWVFVDGETGAVTREFGALDEAALSEHLEQLGG